MEQRAPVALAHVEQETDVSLTHKGTATAGPAVRPHAPFLASTWNPYDVVLFETHLRLRPSDGS